jgi:hypothetical protein
MLRTPLGGHPDHIEIKTQFEIAPCTDDYPAGSRKKLAGRWAKWS